MTSELLERASKELALVAEFRGGLSDAGLLSEIRAELARPESTEMTLMRACYEEQKKLVQQECRLSGRDRDALLNLIAVADCDADVMISDGKAGGQLSKGRSIKRGIEIIRKFIKETP